MSVYFIRCEWSGLIKIGSSSKPQWRLGQLQVGSAGPLSILALARGGKAEEHELHDRFAHRWIRGEWFALTLEEVQRLVVELGKRPIPPKRKRRTMSAEARATIERLLTEPSLSYRDIGKQAGVGATAVSRIARLIGAPARERFGTKKQRAAALELKRAGLTHGEVAARTGLSPHVVGKLARKAGVPSGIPDRAERTARVRELYERGLTDAQIGQSLGIKPSTVARYRRLAGLPHHSKERARRIIADARRLHEDGLSMSEIAKRTGFSVSTISGYLGKRGAGRKLAGDWEEADRLIQEGKLNDRIIAERTGCNATSVWRRRRELEVPPVRTHQTTEAA